MSLKSIVRTLGGDLYDRGLRANIPAPGHSRCDRSVSLLLREGRVIVHTFGDGDWRGVLDDLRRRGLIDARGAPASLGVRQGGPPTPLSITSTTDRLAAAHRIWDLGRPIGGTLSERHCRLRRLERDLPGPDVVRHGGQTPVSAYGDDLLRRPAMLVALSTAEGEFTAVEVTYLTPGGLRAADLKLSRKTVGLVPPGAAARLDPAGPEMLVGEGFFTTRSAGEHFALPGWALTSTRNLRAWSPPPEVRSVLIAADRGQDGEASAEVLRHRLLRLGVRARVALPPEPHGDWNEAADPA